MWRVSIVGHVETYANVHRQNESLLFPIFSFLFLSVISTGCLQPLQQEKEVLDGFYVEHNSEKLIGRLIEVRGFFGRGYWGCTEMACPEENPCCNTCFGGLHLYGPQYNHVSWRIELNESCREVNCVIECPNMKFDERKEYAVIGKLRKDRYGIVFDVINYYETSNLE